MSIALSLFQQLCYRFQSRIDVWMRFLRFYRILGRHMSMVRLWNRILQVHGRTDPRLWAAAAAYHLHEHVEASAKASLRQLTEEAEELTDKRKEVSKELNILKRDADSNQKKSMHKILQDLSK